MILTRLLAWRIRAVFRLCATRGQGRPLARVAFLAGPDGLRARLYGAEVAVEFHQPGAFDTAVVVAPLTMLADVEGRDATGVELEDKGKGRVQVRWQEAKVPQVKQYENTHPNALSLYPPLPAKWLQQAPGFTQALHEAMLTAGSNGARYSLEKVQFRAKAGQLVGTDGHRLLVQSGFTFPWPEDLIVSCCAAFGSRELPADAPIRIGRTPGHVVVQTGPWTFWLPIATSGRYPNVDAVIPRATAQATRCRFHPEDVARLVNALPRPSKSAADKDALTIQLNRTVTIHWQEENTQLPTGVVLTRSTVTGPAVRLAVKCGNLRRAFELGFVEMIVNRPEAAILCQDARRQFIWMPLEPPRGLPPSAPAQRASRPRPVHPLWAGRPSNSGAIA